MGPDVEGGGIGMNFPPVGPAFVRFMVEEGALRFGEFTTKAGRLSPYFFNAGKLDDGSSLGKLIEFYTRRLGLAVGSEGLKIDMLFGPAYKGIPLVSALAIKVQETLGHNYPFAYNRKEAKDHGEGGVTVGAPIQGRVLIVDDVISAGTSVRESIDIIKEADATPAGVLISLDRQEQGKESSLSAVQEVEQTFGIPVFSVATLDDVIAFLMKIPAESGDDNVGEILEGILAYKARYGAAL